MTRLLMAGLFLLLSWTSLAQAQSDQGLYRAERTVLQNAVTAVGNGTMINVERWSTVGLQVTGISTASIAFESTIDGTNWVSQVCNSASDGRLFTSTSGDGQFTCHVTGLSGFRARVSSYTSGTITVTSLRTTAPSIRNDWGSTLLSGEDPANDALAVEGADVRQSTVMLDVTTNTTTAAVILPTGNKTLYGEVVCSSGACTQTQAVYGDVDSDSANGVLLCTLTLSGTTRAQDACPVVTANFSYYYVTTTATTGTAASGAMYSMY